MNIGRAATLTLSLILACASADAQKLQAQVVPGARPQAPTGWAPPSLGIRFGYDNQQRNEVLGAQVRIPVLPGGQIEFMPSMDIAFLRGLKEYQYNFEGVYVWDGRAGGLYGGAGIGLRNSIFGSDPDRSTEMGYSFVVGFRVVGLGVVVPQLEYRWIVIDAAPITYQQLSLGVNIALWRPVPAR